MLFQSSPPCWLVKSQGGAPQVQENRWSGLSSIILRGFNGSGWASELEIERKQEYVLRWSPDDGQSYQEIIRQQWNFSPEGATSEIEDYHVELPAVTILELRINSDISERNAFASLKELRLAWQRVKPVRSRSLCRRWKRRQSSYRLVLLVKMDVTLESTREWR